MKVTIATVYRGRTADHDVLVFKGPEAEVVPKVADGLHSLLTNQDHPDEDERDQLFFTEVDLLDPDEDVVLTYARLY